MIENKFIHRALNSVFEQNLAHYLEPGYGSLKAAALNTNYSRTLIEKSANEQETSPLVNLRSAIGRPNEPRASFGSHPDFAHLNYQEEEYHFCASVFVDLKGSTLLARRLDLPQVRMIKNGLLKSAIQIFHAFDGHVQRLQGDAVFAVFCKKGGSKEDAIIDALNASSILQAFIEDHLNPRFLELGLPPIAARVGVDFGDTSEVMWSRYGIGECHEITTTSLHTDLAAKLQARAPSGGILIGDNVRKYLDLPEEFLDIHTVQRNGVSVPKRYIVDDIDFKYKMWVFDWVGYLKYFAVSRPSGAALLTTQKTLFYTCKAKLPGSELYDVDYLSGCGALPKQTLLEFKISIPSEVRWDDIKWTVENRGSEAGAKEDLIFEMNDYRRKTTCHQITAYLGHHYMRCRIFNQGKLVADERLGVFVRAA